MKRCHLEKHPNYKYYGGKGVTVTERWHDFGNFIYDIDNHMPNGHLLYSSDYQLDKDLKGGKIYSLENCVVMSRTINSKMRNISNRKPVVAIKGIEQIEFESILCASERLNLARRSIQRILKEGKGKTRSGYTFRYIS
ncbi:hypothetical protein [Bacillus wiedmannii]